ncbi:hypothetical protein BS50DRAFT_280145 [Corynespora cassiicola Philippines]|uniref:Uncharacterized protein n=1 Tax=Corynespora cassiicola Philippines TaxID=1448308 RepID=A0A2T2P0Y7_CORCC|nr:hypothetical protein BS50DRAFT_280145 [Corynespora cassiicola Philippines]
MRVVVALGVCLGRDSGESYDARLELQLPQLRKLEVSSGIGFCVLHHPLPSQSISICTGLDVTFLFLCVRSTLRRFADLTSRFCPSRVMCFLTLSPSTFISSSHDEFLSQLGTSPSPQYLVRYIHPALAG